MFLYSRRTILSGIAAVGACATPLAVHAGQPIALPDDIVQRDAATVTAIRTQTPIVAMTFDDGPHPTLTPALLDMLRARGLRATFYLIGNRVATWPDIVRRIHAEGHEIGNHTWSHPNLARLGDASVMAEIDRTSDLIFRITGRPPVTFRPPYGSFSARQRRMLYANRKLPTVLWSVDPQDWRRPGSQVVAQRILQHSRPGAIILSHDIQHGTIRAMPAALDGLRARGLHFGTVSQMMGWPLWQTRHFRRVTATG